MKNARAAHLVALLSSWLGAAPPPLQAFFWGNLPKITLPGPLLHMICTNIPGFADSAVCGGDRTPPSAPRGR
jgi:hypothetical protein